MARQPVYNPVEHMFFRLSMEEWRVSGRLCLFVSAGPDLGLEREFVAQAIARFPVSLGWEIAYTPRSGEGGAPDPGALQRCHFHVIILGADIHAPVGWELWAARGAGKQPIAFSKTVTRTLAAMVFLRESKVAWESFDAPEALMHLLQRALAQRIIADPVGYGLTTTEWQTLTQFLKEAPELDPDVTGTRPGGAGERGVILSPGHDIPEGAVLLRGGRPPARGPDKTG